MGERATTGRTPSEGLEQDYCLSASVFKNHIDHAMKLEKKNGIPM